jgi:phage shock protein A
MTYEEAVKLLREWDAQILCPRPSPFAEVLEAVERQRDAAASNVARWMGTAEVEHGRVLALQAEVERLRQIVSLAKMLIQPTVTSGPILEGHQSHREALLHAVRGMAFTDPREAFLERLLVEGDEHARLRAAHEQQIVEMIQRAGDREQEIERLRKEVERLRAVLEKIALGGSVPGAHPDYMDDHDMVEAAMNALAEAAGGEA